MYPNNNFVPNILFIILIVIVIIYIDCNFYRIDLKIKYNLTILVR